MKSMILRKRYVTLIEMMIVMFLIALIIGVIGYNYRGTLEEGKAFKTKAGIEKLETILNLAIAENPGLQDNIETNWQDVIKTSPLVSNPSSLIKDGWGNVYSVTVEGGRLVVRSDRYDDYIKSNPTMFGEEK
jgi:type II secretory pathway pseudopilin PulG